MLGDLSNLRFIWIDQSGGGLVPEVWFVIFQGYSGGTFLSSENTIINLQVGDNSLVLKFDIFDIIYLFFFLKPSLTESVN